MRAHAIRVAALLLVLPFLAIGASPSVAAAAGAGSEKIFPGLDNPGGIAAGPGGAMWFTSYFNDSVGGVTPSGTFRVGFLPDMVGPLAIAAGPDGAMWFTNFDNSVGTSVGRVTTSGTTSYSGPGIDGPDGIVAGPDGALWFTNNGNNSIGRITTWAWSPTTGAQA